MLAIALALIVPAQAFAADQHVVTPAQLRSALGAAAQTRNANLADVQRFFSDARVREVLGKAKVDSDRLMNTAAMLDDAELAQLAAKVRTAQAQIAGGDATFTTQQVTLLILIAGLLVFMTILVIAFK